MSSSSSANQRLATKAGRTTFISDDRGHLLPGEMKKGSAWPEFKGTWDLPARIPPCRINPTARSQEGLRRLRAWEFHAQHSGKPQQQGGSKSPKCVQDGSEQMSEAVQQDETSPPSTADAHLPSQRTLSTAGSAAVANRTQESEGAEAEATAAQAP